MRCVLDVRRHGYLQRGTRGFKGNLDIGGGGGGRGYSMWCGINGNWYSDLYNNPPSMRPISGRAESQLAGSKVWRPLWKSHLWHCGSASQTALVSWGASGVYLLFPTDSWVRYLLSGWAPSTHPVANTHELSTFFFFFFFELIIESW